MNIKTQAGKPHILMLTRDITFPPSQNAPACRLGAFARHWGELTRVTVITPTYYPPQGNYTRMSFPLAEKRWEFLRLIWLFPRLLRLVRKLDVDIVFASFPYSWELLEAYLLSFRLRCPLIIDIRDLPLIGKGRLLRRIFDHMMRLIANYVSAKANRLLTVTELLKEELDKSFNLGFSKTHVVRNGSDPELFKEALSIKEEIDFVFSGKFSQLENPKGILNYINYLYDIKPAFKALFISDFSTPVEVGRSFLNGIKRIGLSDNVQVERMGPPEELPKRLGGARLGFISFEPEQIIHKGAVGTKVYEYLAAGLPVVGLLDPEFYSEIGKLIQKNEAGIIHPDPKKLAEETVKLLKDTKRLKQMSKRARALGEKFDRREQAYECFNKVILPVWKGSHI